MKSPLPLIVLAAALGSSGLAICGCSKSDDSASTMAKVSADAKDVANSVKTEVSDSWDSIKGYTYDKRVEFSASVDRMAGKLDDQTRDLKAKASNSPNVVSKGWDGAVKEYDEARADLKTKLADLGNATADTWADAKEKAAHAWTRVQAAYDNVKASVT